VIVDVHPRPEIALCDGPQAMVQDDVVTLRETVTRFAQAADRDLAAPSAQHREGAWGRSAS
jgi:3-deoxy-7-phosphoheptulonate synthase